jgi:multisubunit Na+/H+ antiporter MnhF subunit
MRWVCFLFFTAALLVVMVTPVAASTVISISAFPQQAHIGEVVTLNGTISGITTIAVYLFVTGPELDVRGVTLDNLNIPAGRGLFTTAPVNMRDGSWTYTWDTSVILGTLEPGKYTIYVESSPLDRLRYMSGEYATVDVEFLPSDKPVAQTPLEPAIPLIAVGFVTTLGLWRYRTGKET